MFKKFNWGHGIALFYTLFVAVVVTALFASFGVDHSLVVDDYYAQDLAYQKQFDKASNNLSSNNLSIDYQSDKNQISLHFKDEGQIIGQVKFYRPSDKSKDFSAPIEKAKVNFPTQGMAPGRWKLKVDWTAEGKSFYKEEEIFI